MSGYLLDSDWVIDYLKGVQSIAGQLATLVTASRLCISVITYGEVLEGVLYSRMPEHHRAALDEFVALTEILPIDWKVAERFADLRGRLRRQGQLLDNLDLLIASTAMQHDLVLLTRNSSHFARIEGLRLEPAVS